LSFLDKHFPGYESEDKLKAQSLLCPALSALDLFMHVDIELDVKLPLLATVLTSTKQ